MMKQDRNRKLAKDVLVYGIGNMGSRFMAFLMIPLLSFFIASDEIGYYDISLATILFLLPVTTLQMREAVFRLLVDNRDAEYRKTVISTVFFIEGVLFVVILLAALAAPVFVELRAYVLIVLSVYVYSFYELYQYTVRVLYSSRLFAVMGIVTSALTVAFSLLLLFAFDMGIEALFAGNMIARIVSAAAVEAQGRRFLRSLSASHIRREQVGEILKYALPMLVSSVVFGSIVITGKYMVRYFGGYGDNGVLAVAEKYAGIIPIIGMSFYQAWQESAVLHFGKPDGRAFFTDIFNRYALLLGLLATCMAFGVRLFSSVLIGEGYGEALDIIFVLGLGQIFFCLSAFFEIVFQCEKRTSRMVLPVLTGALVSAPLFFLLFRQYGLMGYAATLAVCYVYLFIHRYFQTRKTFRIGFGRYFFLSVLLVAAGGTAWLLHNRFVDGAILLLTVAGLTILCRKFR